MNKMISPCMKIWLLQKDNNQKASIQHMNHHQGHRILKYKIRNDGL